MYLVIQKKGPLDTENYLYCYAIDDPVVVAERLKKGNVKVYKLEGLKEVKDIEINTTEVF